MSVNFHKHDPLERLAPGSVVRDRRGLVALHLGGNLWLAHFKGMVISWPVLTQFLVLPVTLQIAQKEVTE